MKKKSFAESKQCTSNKAFRTFIKFLKRQRNKKARKNGPEEYKKTSAWDIS